VRSYLVDRDLPSNDEQLLLDTELELDFRFAKRMKLLLVPRFLIDGLDTELIRFEPLEGYLAYEGSRTGLKLGQFIENWGVAEVNNPLDVLNRRDFGVKFLDPPRLGELGVRLTQSFEGGKVIGQPTLSAYFMPLFRPALLPTEQSRWRRVWILPLASASSRAGPSRCSARCASSTPSTPGLSTPTSRTWCRTGRNASPTSCQCRARSASTSSPSTTA
jgi:hypothetical protein